MTLAKQWRELWHFRQLHKKLSRSNPNRSPVSYAQSKNIGILFLAAEEGSLQQVQAFEKALQGKGKKVTVLAYYDDKVVPHDFPYPSFSKKDVSLSFQPKGSSVEEFIRTPFDVLFNLYLSDNLMLPYISACSTAQLRIGPATDRQVYFDLMIGMPKGKDLHYFITQVEKILKNVKTDQHAPTI